MLLQTHTPALRALTTAHLAQTMTLLELNSAELRQKVEAELASNPALELSDEFRCPHCRRPLARRGLCPVCSMPQQPADQSSSDQPIVFISPSQDFMPWQSKQSLSEDISAEEWVADTEDLPSYVLRQIAPELAPEDRPLAAHILTSLDEDGLLAVPPLEISRYHHVPLARLEAVLRLIQHAEPVGVGSSSPQEALLIQLEALAETRSVPKLASQAIQNGMDLLSRRAYTELGHLLHVSTSQAEQIAIYISENLNPFPARAHWGESCSTSDIPPVYTNADIIISRLHEDDSTPLVVEIVSPYAGMLRVNSLFREALAQAPTDKMPQWQADMENAMLLVKCLQQRNHTLVRMAQRLVVLQRQFILHGDAYLNPVTRVQLAIELELHESTISRAVAGKAVQLPNKRIIPLSRLFDRSLHIRTALLQIIAQEGRPLSDTELADRLIAQGYPVARRTVAKYRSMEGILPARFRRVPQNTARHDAS